MCVPAEESSVMRSDREEEMKLYVVRRSLLISDLYIQANSLDGARPPPRSLTAASRTHAVYRTAAKASSAAGRGKCQVTRPNARETPTRYRDLMAPGSDDPGGGLGRAASRAICRFCGMGMETGMAVVPSAHYFCPECLLVSWRTRRGREGAALCRSPKGRRRLVQPPSLRLSFCRRAGG